MTEKETTTLYKKVGRRYIPARAQWYEDQGADQMAVGTFRMTYAYIDGGRRYEYDVQPATAPAVAAMMIAKVAMENAIQEASRMKPIGTITRYTKAELACIEKFQKDMAGMTPMHWQALPAYQVADAAIKAVLEFKP